MPTYGEKKKKDIMESVLPATRHAAKSASKDFKQLHRRERRQVTLAVRNMTARNARSSDVIDAYDDDAFDWGHTEDRDIRYRMWERRGADNLAALFRWAPSQVKDVRIQDRLSKMYSILPDNTIGRHAASHLEFDEEFDIDHPAHYKHRYEYYRAERLHREWVRYAQIHEQLCKIINSGKLKTFNYRADPRKEVRVGITSAEYQVIRKRCIDRQELVENYAWYSPSDESYVKRESRPRPLLDIADIPSFVAEVMDSNYWRDISSRALWGFKTPDTMRDIIEGLTM